MPAQLPLTPPEDFPAAPAQDATVDMARPMHMDKRDWTYLGQVANSYLALRHGDELVVIDQHAAHERVLVNAMKAARTTGDSQPLAAPLTLDLHPSEAEHLPDVRDSLADAGFKLDESEPGMLTVTGLPPTLDAGRAKEYLRAALAGGAKTLEDLWTMLSCKSAIKAGDPLAPDEAVSLIQTWLDTPDKEHCPHGCPVVVRFTPGDLEKLFKRK